MLIEIDSERIQSEIDQLAKISEASPPVVTRVLFSKADLQARAYVQARCSNLDLALREDAVGNIFARWPGQEPDLPAVATGSHIDAIPNAGKYDGVVGVFGALEAIRGLKRSGFKPRRSIELVIFTAEEPTRFGIGCLGSRLLTGALKSEQALQLTDSAGKRLSDWLGEIYPQSGGLQSIRLIPNFYSAFIELHIEQGPLLERQRIDLGVVEQIAAPATLRLEFIGEGGHAGAVLMPDRHDALLAGAEIALAVESAAKESQSPDTVATTGVFRIEPGAVNSVPYRALLEIDLRDTRLATRDFALRRIRENISAVTQRRGVQAHLDVINQDPPAVCDAELVQAALQAAGRVGFSARCIVSRAYHDSLFMAQICPTTMLFIPCRNGVSHRPDEYASPEAIYKGTAVLAQLLQELLVYRRAYNGDCRFALSRNNGALGIWRLSHYAPCLARTRSQPEAARTTPLKTAVAIVTLRMAFGVTRSHHAVRHSWTKRWRLHLLAKDRFIPPFKTLDGARVWLSVDSRR